MEPHPPPDEREEHRVPDALIVDEMDDQLQQLERLQSNLDEQAFLAGVEADVSRIVISSSLAGREVEARRVEADVLSQAAAEETRAMPSLQATDDSMEDDRNIVGDRLEMVRGEEDALKNALARALQEKESTLKDLDRKEKELSALEVRVQELEIGIIEATENLASWDIDRRALEEKGKESEKALDSVLQEKAFMEIRLDELKAKNEASAAKVSGLEAERQSLVENSQRLEAEADGLKASILSMKKEEGELRNEIAEMEKKNAKIAEELQSEVAKKEAAVKKVSSLESEVRNLSEGSRRLEADLNDSNSTVESLKKEGEGLRSQVAEMEKLNDEISRKFGRLEAELDNLRNRMREIETEKRAVEAARTAQKAEIDSLRQELQSEVAKKEAAVKKVSSLESEVWNLSEVSRGLEADLNNSNSTVESLKKERERLRSQVAEMEKLDDEISKKFGELEVELGNLRNRTREIETEKLAAELARTAQKAIIDSLREDQRQLRSTVNELQALCEERTNSNAQLQAERDSARRDLDLQKAEEGSLRAQIEELKKRKNEVGEQVQQLRRALSAFAQKDEEWKAQSDAWKVEKTRFEQILMTGRRNFFDMENKFEGAKIKSLRALALLKNTREMMTRVARGNANVVERNIGSGEDLQNNEEMEPFVEELDTIATVFNQTVAKIEDMNRELRDLQEALAKAQRRRRSLMSRLFAFTLVPASTTLVAAISIVYMAKRR